jgi:hypothetical protein
MQVDFSKRTGTGFFEFFVPRLNCVSNLPPRQMLFFGNHRGLRPNPPTMTALPSLPGIRRNWNALSRPVAGAVGAMRIAFGCAWRLNGGSTGS